MKVIVTRKNNTSLYFKKEEEVALDTEYGYIIQMNPHKYLEVRYINSSPTRQIFNTVVPRTNIMSKSDIKFPIFNGNGLKDPDQHWFLCEVMWTM